MAAVAKPSSTDEVAHAALDLAKAGSWQQLFKYLDDHVDDQHGMLVNQRPAVRKYGILHQAAWHGSKSACKTLVEKYKADPSSLTQCGKTAAEIAQTEGFDHLAEQLKGYEEPFSAASAPCISIAVVLPSGETLLEGAQLPFSGKVAELVKLADEALRSREVETNAHGNVTALCTQGDFRMLSLTDSLLAAGLADGNTLTAVVSDDAEVLRIIEAHFHELITHRNSCSKSALEKRGFVFPSLLPALKVHVDDSGTGGGLGFQEYYAVPGMYGGFNTQVVKQETGWKLSCESWCRVCEGSEESHEITVEGTRLISQGAC